MLTIGSLFSGIGGLELGLERAGLGPTVWQVERDEYCRAVLQKHWPSSERFDDVRSVGRHNLRPVDLICGGFPCQDISYAGKGAGISGERSGLWFEYARIVRELAPRFVVVENVAALLARGMGEVLGSLASLGYDCWWDCVPAAAVGAPHIRDRVFIVAYSAKGHAEQRSQQETNHIWAHPAREREGLQLEYTGCGASEVWHDGWSTEPGMGRVVDGVPCQVDRVGSLGNAVVPQCAEVIGWAVRELAGHSDEARP